MSTMEPTLFDPLPALQLGRRKLSRTASKHQRDIERLIPLAREIAAKAGATGVTVSDLRLYAVQRGVLTGAEVGLQLSYLGAVMRAAGLVKTGQLRRSHLLSTHARHQTIWRVQ